MTATGWERAFVYPSCRCESCTLARGVSEGGVNDMTEPTTDTRIDEHHPSCCGACDECLRICWGYHGPERRKYGPQRRLGDRLAIEQANALAAASARPTEGAEAVAEFMHGFGHGGYGRRHGPVLADAPRVRPDGRSCPRRPAPVTGARIVTRPGDMAQMEETGTEPRDNPRIAAATRWADACLARNQKMAWQAGWAMYLAIVRGPDNPLRPSRFTRLRAALAGFLFGRWRG